MTAVSILSDIACHLGEGPTYDPQSDTLFWFDILEKKLLEKRWPDGDVVVHDLPVMASALLMATPALILLPSAGALDFTPTSASSSMSWMA